MDPTDRDALVRLLLRHLAAGDIPASLILPALQAGVSQGLSEAPLVRAELLRALETETAETVSALKDHLKQRRLEDARAAYDLKKAGQPIGDALRSELSDLPLDARNEWRNTEKGLTEIQRLLPLLRDRLFARAENGVDPSVAGAVEQAFGKALEDARPTLSVLLPPSALVAAAREKVGPGELQPLLDRLDGRLREDQEGERRAAEEALDALPAPIPAGLDDATLLDALAARLQAGPSTEARRRLVDAALTWRTDGVASLLPGICAEPWAQDRGALVLALRFGKAWPWPEWLKWLASSEAKVERAHAQSADLLAARPVELLLLSELARKSPDLEVVAALERWCLANIPSASPEAFAQRWGGTPQRVTVAAPAPPALPAAPPTPPRPAPPPGPPAPSLWRDYIQSFLVENWYLVVGLLMVVAGSSLLAYFTWDKHWLLRYTIMPGLLAGFTAGLAGIASWLEGHDARFKGTGALLRGAAVGLLPINFMAVALLSQDPLVTDQRLVVPVMAAVYIALAGWGLRSWCRRIHPPLGTILGNTLLGLNALVILGPVARAAVAVREDALHPVLGAGFYLGFLALAAAVRRFNSHIVNTELAKERRIPWFFGATLVITYLQVFAWVHTFIRHLPEVHTYAPLVVLAGGLVLSAERRFLDLRGEAGRHIGESFLGFAFVLTGVLMGMGQPYVRILTLALAGVVWLRQADVRNDAQHHAIGLVFLCLSGASVGLVDGFPRPWLPAIGITLASGLMGIEAWAAGTPRKLLREAAAAIQQSVLVLTTGVAVLTQWHLRAEPWITAAALLIVAGFFAWRARRERSLRALVTTAVVLAGALPYLGCVDVLGQSLHGNTMVFGLAVLAGLWLALTLRTTDALLLQARSTVLWFYGSLALAAMILRVVVEQETPGDLVAYRLWMDYAGPLLMAAVLVVTAYLSRSMVPAWMAALVVVVLFPELKAHLRIVFPGLTWGSGLGSAFSALGLTALGFRLRSWPLLRSLGPGDLFLGRDPFPVRRTDATLFTTPAIASALFLAAKVNTWSLARNLQPGGSLGLKTCAALAIVAVTWTLVAIFLRQAGPAVVAVHLGWFAAFLSIGFGFDHLPGPPASQWTFVATLLLLQALEFVYRHQVPKRPWAEGLLLAPTSGVLKGGSLVLAAGTLVALWQGGRLESFWALLLLVGCELGARGLATGRRVYGAAFFVLGWTALLVWTSPGVGPLVDRVSAETSLSPTLWMCLTIQLLHAALELRPRAAAALQPLLVPLQVGVTVVAAGLGCFGLVDAMTARAADMPQMALLLAVALLTARAHGSGFFALVSALLGYVVACHSLLEKAPTFDARLELLLIPWRVAVLALAMATAGALGRWLHERRPSTLVGSLGFPDLRWPATPWILGPATVFALLAALRQTVSPVFREQPAELWASYVGAAALMVIGWSWGQALHYGLGGLLLTLGNVHAVRVFFGAPLRAGGLSEDHLVSLGLGATLLEGTALRIAARRERLTAAINTASLPLATLILTLLCTNYFIRPDLASIPPLRFVISGSIALLAGFYFRRASIAPGPGEAPYVDLCASLYHFAVTLAIWCTALLVPWFRQPATALLALGIPVFYFYARAEEAFRAGDEVSVRRYRTSAATLGFLLLGLYVFRAAFQMVLFPETPIATEHYHQNAPYLMLLALVLLRLHALGGTDWLAFYGGLALVAGSYFTLTWLPGLSPFEKPVPAAWCGVALVHFWTVATYQQSPLRSAVQAMAAIDMALWLSLRRSWGRAVLVGAHVLVGLAILDPTTDTHAIAPLLLGAASVLVHQGIQRQSPGYLGFAALEVAFALHADFVVPSYLKADDIIWVLLGLWSLFIAARGALERWALLRGPGTVAAIFAAMIFAHVLHHHPSSTTGLWAAAFMAVLGLLSPCETTRARTAEQTLLAGLPILAPAWLVFFGQTRLPEEGFPAALHAWPLLATAATLLLTGTGALAYQNQVAELGVGESERAPRLLDQTRAILWTHGLWIRSALLGVSFAMAVGIQVLHYGRAFATRDLALFLILYTAFVASWLDEGRARKSMVAYALAQISIFGLFGLVRRQLTLTTDFWGPEYDIWLSLLVSLGLTGAKPWIDRQPREARLPSMVSLLALPVAAIVWTLVNNLGSDTALLVVGLHAIMFAFLGREERDSPFNLLAVSGFVAFVLIVLWSKLELRVLQAYVIPVGLGILVLLQLFGRGMDPGTRNRVRAVTLLAMLGSSGYYALVDDRYPLAFHVTLLLLCLGGMGLGSFLRIRLYLALGSAGVVVDVASIVLKALLHMDRGPRMTAVGLLVLALGACLVAGAVYYKTHRDPLNARVDSWRKRLGGWE